jgi:catechol 2,3-dioxygenase-like lactoylglutathione lyase family enzyme
MFSHIMVGADNMAASKKFYDAVLGTLGHPEGTIDDKGRCFYFTPTGIFSLSTPINGDPACGANGGTVGFAAASPAEADAWHQAGLDNGGTTLEDPPGERPDAGLYLAYLRDPSGNKICALHQLG